MDQLNLNTRQPTDHNTHSTPSTSKTLPNSPNGSKSLFVNDISDIQHDQSLSSFPSLKSPFDSGDDYHEATGENVYLCCK